jgi:hypothetical protein
MSKFSPKDKEKKKGIFLKKKLVWNMFNLAVYFAYFEIGPS